MSAPGYTDAELEQLVELQLDQALDAGQVIRNVDGWRRDCRARTLANEQAKPGYIHRLVVALTAKSNGARITRCTESRGTHAISYLYDPEGTAEPPPHWDEDEARRQWEAERDGQARRGAPPSPIAQHLAEHMPEMPDA